MNKTGALAERYDVILLSKVICIQMNYSVTVRARVARFKVKSLHLSEIQVNCTRLCFYPIASHVDTECHNRLEIILYLFPQKENYFVEMPSVTKYTMKLLYEPLTLAESNIYRGVKFYL